MKAKSRAGGSSCVGCVDQAKIHRTCKVTEETLEGSQVELPRVGHELAELVDDEKDVRPSPLSDEHTQSSESTKIWHGSRIGLGGVRAVLLGPNKARHTRSSGWTAVFHARTHKKISDALVLAQKNHCSA